MLCITLLKSSGICFTYIYISHILQSFKDSCKVSFCSCLTLEISLSHCPSIPELSLPLLPCGPCCPRRWWEHQTACLRRLNFLISCSSFILTEGLCFLLSLRKIKVMYLLGEKKNTWEKTGKAWKKMFMKLNAVHMNDDSLVSTLIFQRKALLLKTERISMEF